MQHPVHHETYHSTFGARTESISVFLQNSGVSERLQAGTATRILEIGFGTGLNFMITADVAEAASCKLEYVAVELDPLADEVLSELLSLNFPNQLSLTAKTIDAVRTCKHVAQTSATVSKPAINHALSIIELTRNIRFGLIVDDALTSDWGDECFDAVYLDAFSPKNNPDLWSAAFLTKVRRVVATHGRLVSYCVSRQFRDSLSNAGFQWQKVKGPPGKREVLIASPL